MTLADGLARYWRMLVDIPVLGGEQDKMIDRYGELLFRQIDKLTLRERVELFKEAAGLNDKSKGD